MDLRLMDDAGTLIGTQSFEPFEAGGSADAYGVLAWSIENGGVRDLGQLQIALPEEKDV